MNGGWFWWGNDGYKNFYRMLHGRLNNFHSFSNLIWVNNTNEFKPDVDCLDECYIGDDCVNIIATDVYTEFLIRKAMIRLRN